MSDKQSFRLSTPTARQNAAQAVVNAPLNFVVEIKPRTRSLDQNAMLHALFSDIEKQATLHGRRLTAVQWKTVFISAHATATGLGSDMVAGLEGEFVNIRESSARMSVARMTSLIEYILAWCADNSIATVTEEFA
ncbi:recombination protein NinB [Paraburkholderia sp.]|uniref:recombination protein NinB n=1 Tax=Paraburkholderia sp. TaxID=1926495 RepID=UPI002398C465|nr:recombination protein NinB [Paraburkholderia sp.]MDE1179479.1 recombination protein NinB [Paraburkholderia sp.]